MVFEVPEVPSSAASDIDDGGTVFHIFEKAIVVFAHVGAVGVLCVLCGVGVVVIKGRAVCHSCIRTSVLLFCNKSCLTALCVQYNSSKGLGLDDVRRSLYT